VRNRKPDASRHFYVGEHALQRARRHSSDAALKGDESLISILDLETHKQMEAGKGLKIKDRGDDAWIVPLLSFNGLWALVKKNHINTEKYERAIVTVCLDEMIQRRMKDQNGAGVWEFDIDDKPLATLGDLLKGSLSAAGAVPEPKDELYLVTYVDGDSQVQEECGHSGVAEYALHLRRQGKKDVRVYREVQVKTRVTIEISDD
jgi:hypothetical protein